MKLFKMESLDTGEVKYYRSKQTMCKENKFSDRLVSYVINKQRNHHKEHIFERLDVNTYEGYDLKDSPIQEEDFVCNEIIKPTERIKSTPKTNNSDIKLALLFGDTHFNLEHKPTLDIMMQILKDYDFDEIVNGGDATDFGDLSEYDYFEDIEADFKKEKIRYEQFMFDIKTLQPNAKFVELYSNHFNDRAFRVSRRGDFKKYGVEDTAFKFFTDLSFPYDYRTDNALEVYYPFEQQRIGGIHGIKHSMNVAKDTGNAMGSRDIFHFHTHTVQTFTYTNETPYNKASRFYALPCCCKKDLKYRRNMTTRWVNGFAILTYLPETDYYSLDFVIVEDGTAVYNGKVYKSEV
jgi:hypothetical protein